MFKKINFPWNLEQNGWVLMNMKYKTYHLKKRLFRNIVLIFLLHKLTIRFSGYLYLGTITFDMTKLDRQPL